MMVLGTSRDILNKIGEPYIKSEVGDQNHKGLGLGIFIGKLYSREIKQKLFVEILKPDLVLKC